MPDKKFKLEIVTPDRKIYSEEVDFSVFPGTEGELGVLVDHAPLVSRLSPGEIRITRGTTVEHLAISGGFLEVMKNDVSVLAETAERAKDIDVPRAEKAKAEALEGLKTATTEADKKVLLLKQQKAEARIKVAQSVKQA